mgnify:CR=1 FL=1
MARRRPPRRGAKRGSGQSLTAWMGQASQQCWKRRKTTNIDEAMVPFIRKKLKWTHRELHDALLVAGVAAPPTPSIRNYVSALYAQYGGADAGFLPQSFNARTKDKLKSILRILGRTGLKLGGKLSDNKIVLAERLARRLNRVLEAGREVPGGASSGEGGSAADDLGERPLPPKPFLAEHAASVGEIP